MSKKKYEYEFQFESKLECDDTMDYFTFIEAFNDFIDQINKQNKGLKFVPTCGKWIKTYDPKKKQRLKIGVSK